MMTMKTSWIVLAASAAAMLPFPPATDASILVIPTNGAKIARELLQRFLDDCGVRDSLRIQERRQASDVRRCHGRTSDRFAHVSGEAWRNHASDIQVALVRIHLPDVIDGPRVTCASGSNQVHVGTKA